MGAFQDYIRRNFQRETPKGYWTDNTTGISGQPIQTPEEVAAAQPAVAPSTTTAAPQPQIDTSNAIGSLADMLGPTPAEREARERRMQESKAKMQMWAGLFDGLRQLGNLYYTAKGATPQNLATPYQQIDQQYQQQRALEDGNDAYRRQYATSLYNLRRQISDDARRDMLAKAQADYYGTRDEVARMKAENDKLKAVRVIKQKDGSLMKFDPISGNIEPLTEADPLYVEYMKSRINQTNKRTGLLGAPVTTTTNGPKGTTTSTKSYGSGGGSSSKRKRGKGRVISGYKTSGTSGGSNSTSSKGKAY